MIASTIFAAAGTALSGLLSWRNNQLEQRRQEAEAARSISNADAHAAQNPLDSSTNQALMAENDRLADEQRKTAAATNKLKGAAPEADLVTEKAIADSRAEMMTGMSAAAGTRADQWALRAEQARQAAADADMARLQKRNETFANLTASAAQVAANATPHQSKDWNDELTALDAAYNAGNSGLTEAQYNAARNKINDKIANMNQRRWG